MRLISARFEVKPEDLWIGAFWRHTMCQLDSGPSPLFTDIWICVIPCLPFHITIQRQVRLLDDDK